MQVQVDDRLGARRDGVELRTDRGVERPVVEVGHLADGRHQQGRTAVEHVVAHHHRPALGQQVGALVGLQHLHHAELVLAVVAPGQHLEHRLAARRALLEAAGEETDDALGDRDERVDALGAVGLVVGVGQGVELGPHRGHHAGAGLVDGGLVEPAEPGAAGQVADQRLAQLGRDDEPVEHVVRLAGPLAGRCRGAQPLLQHGGDDADVLGLLLLGEEQPVDGLLELGGAVELGDAVVRQRADQPVLERLRQLLPLDVEALQVGVEVLARAVHALVRTVVVVLGTVAGQLGDVGEHAQDGELGGQPVTVAGAGAALRDGQQVGDGALGVGRREVEAQQHAAQVVQRPGAPGVGVERRRRGQLDDDTGLGGRRLLVVVTERLEPQERRAGLDLASRRDVQLAHPGARRGRDHGLHLHRLEHEQASAGLDLVADRHRGGDHESRCGRTHHAALVAGDPVGDAVDVDAVHGAVGRGHHPVRDTADRDPGREAAQPLDLDVEGVGPVGSQRDPVPLGRHLRHGDPLRLPAQGEVDRTSGLVPGLRTAAVRGLEEVLPLDGLLVLVRLDRGHDERDGGVGVRDEASGGAHPVDPPGVGGAVDHLGLVEQVEQEALVGGAAGDHDVGVGERAPQPGQRLVAVAAVGDDLGDHRVEVGGDGVALPQPGVDADAGAGGEPEQLDAPGGGGEVAVGVLGVQPGLDGVAALGRRVALEPTAGRDVQLGLHQVDPGGELGDRVLDLQPGVDLEERERPVAGVVEELDGGGAAVADAHRQPLGRVLQPLHVVGTQRDRRRLLDHLLVAPLHASSRARPGPRRSRRR